MLRTQPLLHLARVVVETVSPLSIGAGRGSALFDVQIVTEANGLPAIPGSSLAGVLRHALSRRFEAALLRELFGYADGNQGAPSAVTFTWGHIHDQTDRPIDGPDLDHRWTQDPILKPFERAALPHRDHVRLNHAGVAAARGKFDRSFVPAGYRFTFEMALSESKQEPLKDCWAGLLATLASPGFRLGGATRAGYGQLRVVRLAAATFDLSTPEGFAAYGGHPVWLNADHALPAVPSPDRDTQDWRRLELMLEPEDFWRFGGGHTPLAAGKPADALPYTEERLVWAPSGPTLVRRVVAPASGIKGALAHRVAYHYNRLTGCFADQAEEREAEDLRTDRNPAVRRLFGHARERLPRGADKAAVATGQAGAVLIDDVVLAEQLPVGKLAHNSLDRYTGGTREGVLFTEEVFLGGKRPLTLRIARQAWDQADANIREAWRRTIADLLHGRLSLGAGAAKGHGYFTGTIIHSDLEEAT